MATPNADERICRLCRESCSGQPRVKDSHGRYYHRECYERYKKQQAAVKEAKKSSTPKSAKPAPGIDALQALASNQEEAPPIDGADLIQEGRCGACGEAMPEGSVVCTMCGFNVKTGQRLRLEIERESDDAKTKKRKWRFW